LRTAVKMHKGAASFCFSSLEKNKQKNKTETCARTSFCCCSLSLLLSRQ